LKILPLLCHFNVRTHWPERQSSYWWGPVHRLDWDAGAL